MRHHLATIVDDFRPREREVAVVRYQGNRRRTTTYGELAKLAGRFATLLAQRQIGPGERVLIWAQNSVEWIAAFHGCMMRGVLAVPLDAFGTMEFAVRVAADVRPKLVVGDATLLEQLPISLSTLSFEDWSTVLPAEEIGPVIGLSPETPLEILFTSGTTGEPKGIVLTHGNVLASVRPIEEGAKPYLRLERLVHPLRILHTLPLSHVFGQTMGLWVPPILTAELHFEERLVAPRLVEMIRRERISVLAAVPRVLMLLKTHLELTYPELAEKVAQSQSARPARRWWRFRKVHRALGLKFWALISGGGALSASLEQFWNALGFVLVQGYGMTETTALITLNHPFHVTKGTVGKPLAGREVKLGPDGEVLVRGASISGATWSSGAVHPRTEEWLSTGDLAEIEPSGDLRFLGRKSEVIVTTAGVNVHPEDLETAIEEQTGVAACAVVPMNTAEGPEPCAVLAIRGSVDLAAVAIESANLHLAEFQRLRRWVVWPEPDLPRTSTGKVRRKTVAEWLKKVQSRATTTSNGKEKANGSASSQDWLLTVIEQISGNTHPGSGDELHLTEDLHLDSLGRVQLAAAIEDRLGIISEDGTLDRVETLGELRRLIGGEVLSVTAPPTPIPQRKLNDQARRPSGAGGENEIAQQDNGVAVAFESGPAASFPGDVTLSTRGRHIYPRWPWLWPFQWIRVAFIEAMMRPLVWLLAKPRVVTPAGLKADEPMLIIANHVTAFDAPLVEYALPAALRRRIAVAMSGEMLSDYRHFRNSEPLHPTGRFFLPGPLFYFLLTALFNVFPLPRRRDFQQSFAHAGKAMDRGYSVLVFPEGTRSADGNLAQFRPGIGLLAKQCGSAVLPVAVCGLGELKIRKHGWFRSGIIEVRVGTPIHFASKDSEASITARLHDAVESLMDNRP